MHVLNFWEEGERRVGMVWVNNDGMGSIGTHLRVYLVECVVLKGRFSSGRVIKGEKKPKYPFCKNKMGQTVLLGHW